MDYEKYIRVVEGFPKPGISFKDITSLTVEPEVFSSVIDDMAKIAEEYHPDIIIGPESRGFVFGAPLAYKMGLGFIMLRKAGKLPGKTLKKSYALEYGTATVEVAADSFKPGQRVLIVDDLMATGGTFEAVVEMIREAGAVPVCCLSLITLVDLHGEKNVTVPCRTLCELKGA